MGSMGWQEVADRVWFRRYEYGDENVGLIGGDGELLVVDTRATEVHARELIADIRRLSDEPIVGVVNTHGHWDHAFGNAAFGGVPIWGHRTCPDFMAATAEPMRQRLMSTEPFNVLATELRELRVVPPDHLVDTAEHLSIGGRTVVLRYLGQGHTDGDLIVEVPDCSVTFVGDLVKQNGPPGYRDGYPLEWPGTLRQLIGRLAGPVVPGHGELTDRSFVESFAGQLDAVAELILSVLEGRVPPDEAAELSPVHPRAFAQALGRATAGG